jgi:hypothetical protein
MHDSNYIAVKGEMARVSLVRLLALVFINIPIR